MPRKTLRVQVELDIQAVTCPGVWLCPNGRVSLQVFMLDSCINTTGLQPVFPLLYHEKFVFYKNFHSAYSLIELQRLMNKEFLYAELIQWQNCDIGNVIASFQTSLYDVLYPTSYEGAIAGVDVDLLMEPSKHFPGIIAPKIEISTRTTVEEIVCPDDPKRFNSFVVNPKTVTSEQCPCGPKRKQLHQQKVCHSVGYHNRTRRCSKIRRPVKPPFVYRKPEEELLSRKPQGFESDSTKHCKCCAHCQNVGNIYDEKKGSRSRSPSSKIYTKVPQDALNLSQYLQCKSCIKKTKMCSCGSGHIQENCPLCSKYRYYFEGGGCSCTSPTRMAGGGCRRSLTRDSYAQKVTTASPVRDHDKHSSRSPVKIVGRPHCSPIKTMQCACSTSRTTFDSTGQEVKMCDCTSMSNDEKSSRRTCFCPSPKKPSLAEQIHYRLRQTLDCVPAYPFVTCTHEPNSGSTSLCSCPKFRNCKEGFYKNLGKFYKDLRRC